MIRPAAIVLLSFVGLTACRDDGAAAATTEEVASVSAPTPPVPAPDPSEVLRAGLQAAVAGFEASRGAPPEQRAEPLLRVAAAVEAGRGKIDVAAYERSAWRSAFEVANGLSALEAEEKTAAASAPAALDPPKLDLPKYMGAERLGGVYRGPFKAGGIIVESRGKYYVIEDAARPDVDVVHGYVDDTGREVTLDIGREGRTAKVVTLSDKESYRDDHLAHREALATAQREHAEAQGEYQRQLAQNGAAIAGARKARAERETRRVSLASDLATIIDAIDHGKLDEPLKPSSPVGGAPAAAAVVAIPGGPALPSAAAEDRAACMRACIGQCADDPGCERACATSKCR